MAVSAPPFSPSMATPFPASLYVGDLHPLIDEVNLSHVFSEYQSLSSIHVCCDRLTGRSLCYGYVNFFNHQDAIHAIEFKNNTILYGKMIRVTWSRRDPIGRKTGVGNVFVKNLSESIDNIVLKELFKSFGNILSCKVVTFEDGKSKGYGFVQFESEQCANAAIEKLNGNIVEGKKIYVAKFIRKSDRVSSDPDKYTNLYIKNFETDTTEEMLEQSFSKFGKILSLLIAKDDNGVSRGFGFVNFENPDDARKALQDMHESILGSKVLYVARAQKKVERQEFLRHQFEERKKELILKYQGSNVYVKNIDDDVSENDLKEYFSQCGTIRSAKVMCNEKGLSKGFGFVCFSTPDEANKAVHTLNGYIFHGKPLFVAIAQRKSERQATLQMQYAQHNTQHMVQFAGPSSVIPGGYRYPPIYYANPSVLIPQIPPQPGLMYQPMGMMPGWRPTGFTSPVRPTYQTYQPSMIFNTPRLRRQNRRRMNAPMHQPLGGATVPYWPWQQPTYTPMQWSSNQQWAGHVAYGPINGGVHDANIGLAASLGVGHVAYGPINGGVHDANIGLEASVGEGSEMLSSRLASASPEIQKQILWDRLYPLVNQLKPNLASNITGMLLEMDNSELLLLLESPESLAVKVEEAEKVLEISKTNGSTSQEFLPPDILSSEAAIN